MAIYYVNKEARYDGYHEVHQEECTVGPEPANAIKLGNHFDCISAVRAAKRLYIRSDGCEKCCPDCHTR